MKLIVKFVFFLALFEPSNSFAQWQITNGPCNPANVYTILKYGTDIFAATDSGVYKSSSSPINWQIANNGIPKSGGNHTNCFLDGGSYLFAGTSNNGIFRSNNSGSSWVAINSGLPTNASIICIVLNGSTLFASTQSGVYKSTNSGASWTLTSNGLSIAPTTMAANGSVIFIGTNSSGLYSSSNNGVSWQQVSTSFSGSINHIIIDNVKVVVGTNNGVHYSNIGTSAWTSKLGIIAKKLLKNGINSYAITPSELNISTDYWASYQCFNNGISLSFITDIVVLNNGNILVCGNNGGIFQSTNGGTSWFPQNNGFYQNSSVDVLASNSSNLFSGTNGGIFLTSDSGSTWHGKTIIQSPYTCANNNGGFSGAYALNVQGPVFYAGGSNDISVSIDSAASWKKYVIDPLGSMSVFDIEIIGTEVFIGTLLGVYSSSDNGQTWTPRNVGFVSIPTVYSIEKSGNIIWLGTSNGIYMSSDNGNTWVLKRNLMHKYIMTVGSTILAGPLSGSGSSGIIYSNDQGSTWTSSVINGGFMHEVTSFAKYGNFLFAGDWYQGVFMSSDNGLTWSPFKNGLTNWSVRALSVHNGYLYAGTANLAGKISGVWRHQLFQFNSLSEYSINQNSLLLFPNPTDEILNIELANLPEEPVTLNIENMLGQIVYSSVVTNAHVVINTAFLNSGFYTVKINNLSGLLIQRLVKK
jgi:photosystem II stability/assembly factor-like uncharacterized protein